MLFGGGERGPRVNAWCAGFSQLQTVWQSPSWLEGPFCSVCVLPAWERKQQLEKRRCISKQYHSSLWDCLSLVAMKRFHRQWFSGWAPPLAKAYIPLVSMPHDSKGFVSVFAREHVSSSYHGTWKNNLLGSECLHCLISSPHFTAEKIEARRVKPWPRELDT